MDEKKQLMDESRGVKMLRPTDARRGRVRGSLE